MSLNKYNNVTKNLKQIAINNFIGGITWGLGATVGIALIVIVLGFLAQNVDVVPVVGQFAADVTKFVLDTLSKTPDN